jgi:hypothetical protein
MVPHVVATEHTSNPDPQSQLNVDPDHVHLLLTSLELDIIIDALRSVGNTDLADRLEAILRLMHQTGTSGTHD